ncbi:MAG: YidC/Oxa1 family membrane protein insertase [Firmicutes bacterium]|nr:YidC/Oxa1 family membrane protein insertase [Bacillota bacterium]MDY5677133.1 membrane protein insertase YidC [Eubacteriales bacterium]
MDLLNAVTLVKPLGFWPGIIYGMEGAVGNYALALILVTIIIKLIMVPLDFVNRYTSKKSARKQAEIKPELDKINAKYANDKNLLNQKTMELYKAHNYNITGTCFGMLAYLVLTMVVFWTLFGALNNISAYKIGDQYLQVRKEYFAVYEIDVDSLADEQTVMDAYNAKLETLTEEQQIELKNTADKKAKDKYDQVSTSFLWIKNIWLADSTVSPVMKYDDFIKKSKVTKAQVSADEYNLVITPMSSVERKNNGYFVLAVLAAGLNYLSYGINNWISKARAKKKGLDPNLASNTSNKAMSIIMPIIMGIFTLFYNAAFGLYIVAGALITLITSPLVTLFVDMLEFDAISKEKQKTVAIYDRKRK